MPSAGVYGGEGRQRRLTPRAPTPIINVCTLRFSKVYVGTGQWLVRCKREFRTENRSNLGS